MKKEAKYNKTVPRCDICRWGIKLEHRYDQMHCVNEDSPEAFGDVECSFSCELFEVKRIETYDK